MYDITQEDGRRPQETADLVAAAVPPLRLAGVDEDDLADPHLVRGID
ncbi:hypothetical protein J2X68_007410 [Streptomyces sp. 3330]|nr:hypothetical protein [Streptomyces sp. 3330]MDR6980668.1 hypothetical protein [Streptomyces sp. 3330]